MINYLEQFLEVAISTDVPDLNAEPRSDGQDVLLVRECKKVGKNIEWRNTYQKILIPTPEELSIPIDLGLLNKARNTPLGKNVFEIDFFLTPAQVREKNERPFFFYMLLIVDQRSELVISNDLLNPSGGIDEMLAKIPGLLLKTLSGGKILPQKVFTGSPRLTRILAPLMKSLGIKLQYKQNLRSLETAKNTVIEYLCRR